MKRILRLFAIALLLLLVVGAWFWWNQPKSVDMAAYAPADSLVYIESNSVIDVAQTIARTDAWRTLGPYPGMNVGRGRDRWLAYIARWTGIGSAETVIAARAQLAFVMLDLSATDKGDTLEFKPLAALVIETHTSPARVKPVVERIVGNFAQQAYGLPRLEQVKSGDSEFIEWIAPDGDRRIVASVEGTVAIIGNDERAVAECLAVRRGQRPSLLNQFEIQQMRSRLGASGALAFGYVSSSNSARLFSVAAPLLFGKMPDELQFQKLLAFGASRVIDGVGWSARPFAGGIEDRYLFSLKPAVLSRLRSAFQPAAEGHPTSELLPANTHSLTRYNFRDPAAAWDSLNAAVSSQVDALSAVLFASGLKALLVPYGIDEPQSFLHAIKSEVLTVRLEAGSERPLVIATVADESTLRQLIAKRVGLKARRELVGNAQLIVSSDGRSAASFVDRYLIMGSIEDVRRCLAARAQKTAVVSSLTNPKALTTYGGINDKAEVVTYANDNERVRGLVIALATLRGRSNLVSAEVDRVINSLPYAVTETSLGDYGFERRTRSPFGQFSSVLPLLVPAKTP